jgi:N-acyl-phosphatidylethanolamine-hydrolysing phospholipase D
MGRFYNIHFHRNYSRTIKEFLLWQLGYYKSHEQIIEIPAGFAYPNPKEEVSPQEPKVTWLGHSTFLVQVGGMNLLTDPVWSKRCSPLPFLGPKRSHPIPLSIEELPEIDLVLISHNHYDHLDRSTVLKLARRFPKITWVVPEGVKKWFHRRGQNQVVELLWWERSELSLSKFKEVALSITAVPAQHFSGRGLLDRDDTLWAGFVVEFTQAEAAPKRLYFVGDTGYNEFDFKQVGEVFEAIDLSLIPIGSYVPHQFMDPVHIDPYKAALIHLEAKSKLSVAMHWNTFRLSHEPLSQPPYDLLIALKEEKIDPHSFRVLDVGQAINW